jgi:hypothetical protein
MVYKLLVFLPFLFCGINTCQAQSSYRVIETDSNRYVLQVKIKGENNDSVWLQKVFPYKVLKCRKADINGDGKDDYIVAVEKATILDTMVRRRLNIWQIAHNRIEPLWLSSFLSHPVFDFDIVYRGNDPRVITIEAGKNNRYLMVEYKWHSFGLKFVNYIKTDLSLDEAINTLKTML